MSGKKKILIRIGSLRHGGAEKVLVTFLKNLPEDKYEIDLLLNLYSGKYLSEVPSWINVLYLHKGEMITTNRLQDIPEKAFRVVYQKILKKFPKILYSRILKDKKYDIEFAAIHGFRDEILSSPIKSSKKIIWIHNDLRKTHFHNYTDDEIRKFFGFDKVMVISEQIEKDFENLAKNEDEKNRIVKIYNPLDTAEILKKAEEKTKDCFVPRNDNSEPIFVSVGTVFPQKGFDRLLKVHKKLLEEGFPHKIQILGDGRDFEMIKNLKTELGVDETTEMLGFTENPYPYFKKADFYILSSRYEGFPTVLFEAITLKKNIIATEVSGVREMLEDGKLGLIVENSEEGIYEGMKKALTNPDFFKTYQENLKNYKMPFNLENSVNSIMKIIDELHFMKPDYQNLGLSSPMSSELRSFVERQLTEDLKNYGFFENNLKFDWSKSCIEGHLSNYLNSSLENYSGISVFDNNDKLIADGWMEYINEKDFEKDGTFFIVFWDFVTVWKNNLKIKEKSKPGIPEHIWEKIPEHIKPHIKNERMK